MGSDQVHVYMYSLMMVGGEGAGKRTFFIYFSFHFFPALCETYALCVVATTGHAAWDCGASIK